MPPQVITYAYIRGRWYAFPDINTAKEGVLKYNGNYQSIRTSRPVGAIIDEETLSNKVYWPFNLADAPGVTGDALINPLYNPIQGPDIITPEITVETPAPTSPAVTPPDVTPPAPSGNGGGTDYYTGPKRESGTLIAGTNISQAEVNANIGTNRGDAVYWEERIANSDNPNDVLFEMAFWMGDKSGTGGGNEFVGKLQSSQYKMDQGQTWAQQSSKKPSGSTDAYKVIDPVTGETTDITYGKNFQHQFKHGEWEPGDFKTGRARNDADMWRDLRTLRAGDDEELKSNIQKRWEAMVGA